MIKSKEDDNNNNRTVEVIKHYKKYYEIKEMFESLEERWYWFTLVERPDKYDPYKAMFCIF
jgi:hypothetical protein